MGNIGTTVGDTPDYVEDGDLKTVEELRGAFKEMHKAKLSLNQKATIAGVLCEIAVVKQQLEMTAEQLRVLIGLYQTISQEFEQYRQQRVVELNLRVNGGSTTPEDAPDYDSSD